ncbi:hypothetical protein JYQ62_32435 [Nostoc sp. UHCC 0702]|nr:hypothetical protein JYQ62_32435 [Nostoc sp. UHCC 0702]
MDERPNAPKISDGVLRLATTHPTDAKTVLLRVYRYKRILKLAKVRSLSLNI